MWFFLYWGFVFVNLCYCCILVDFLYFWLALALLCFINKATRLPIEMNSNYLWYQWFGCLPLDEFWNIYKFHIATVRKVMIESNGMWQTGNEFVEHWFVKWLWFLIKYRLFPVDWLIDLHFCNDFLFKMSSCEWTWMLLIYLRP